MGFYIYPVREQTRGPQSKGSKCTEGQGGSSAPLPNLHISRVASKRDWRREEGAAHVAVTTFKLFRGRRA